MASDNSSLSCYSQLVPAHILKTDSRGNVGTCTSCSQATHTTVQALDLQAHDATFHQSNLALIFALANMQAKKTLVTPISLFP
jgi:hypothetical protein